MRKSWMILGLLAGALVFVTGGLANNGHGHGNSHHKFGPYDVVTDDHGSCGNAWAVDTEKRTYKMHAEPRRQLHAAPPRPRQVPDQRGPEPGRLRDARPHGSMVDAGKNGRFHGFLRGRVTGGTFDPNATCPADCGFTDVFIATFFGPNATFSCFTDSRACAFDFEYTALRHRSLKSSLVGQGPRRRGAAARALPRRHRHVLNRSDSLSSPKGPPQAGSSRWSYAFAHEPTAADGARLGGRGLRADRAQARPGSRPTASACSPRRRIRGPTSSRRC